MIACRMEPMPLTTAMMQAPMVRKIDSIYKGLSVSVDGRKFLNLGGTRQRNDDRKAK